MRFCGIAQDSSDALLLEKRCAHAAKFRHGRERRRHCGLSGKRRRSLHGADEVWIVRLGRREAVRLLIDDDRAFQFAAKFFEILFRLGIDVNRRTTHGAKRARRPSRGSNR